MARWGAVDLGQLKALQKKVDRLAKVDLERFSEAAVRELAARMLGKVKKRTPVDTGNLRRDWTVGPVTRKGKMYEIEVINNTEYAAYVEYGHRTKDHKAWVPGRYMMTISAKELQQDGPKIIEKKLLQFMAKELNNK